MSSDDSNEKVVVLHNDDPSVHKAHNNIFVNAPNTTNIHTGRSLEDQWPDAKTLSAYEQLHPGFVSWWMQRTEKEQLHRHSLEQQTQSSETALSKQAFASFEKIDLVRSIGIILILVCCLLVISIAVYFHQPWVAGCLVLLTFTAVSAMARQNSNKQVVFDAKKKKAHFTENSDGHKSLSDEIGAIRNGDRPKSDSETPK